MRAPLRSSSASEGRPATRGGSGCVVRALTLGRTRASEVGVAQATASANPKVNASDFEYWAPMQSTMRG